ncbi:MAG: cell division protein FtsH [Planctomycetota bacterium]
MTISDEEEETITAYHEAGHAVVGYALGAAIESIGLYAEADDFLPERFGDCHVNWGRVDPNANWQIQREILTILAGPVAENIYRGESLHVPSYPPWRHDWQLAVHRTHAMADPLRQAKLLNAALALLERHLRDDHCWAAVAAVADELLAHEYLEGDQIADALAFWIGSR